MCGGSTGQPSMGNKCGGRRKQKKVVASTGLVANVISKEYGGSVSAERGKRSECSRPKRPWNVYYSQEEAEEFLCSMLGGSCDLDPAVVKDVFGHSGYDVEKPMYGHLDSACYTLAKETEHGLALQDDHRDCDKNHTSSEGKLLLEPGTRNLDLQQDVLAALFNVPNNSKQESSSMNWRKALKNVESFSQGLQFLSSGVSETHQKLQNDKMGGDDVFRTVAGQHWAMMKSYYQQAAVAYSKGDRAHASYLSEKGKFCSKLAHDAEEKASQEIFEARNKDIGNAVTIDLHGQHVKQAIRLLKVHLLLLTYVPSIKFLRVITGCGRHSVGGGGRLKQSATGLLKKEGIAWSEDNPGTLVIGIDRSKKYSFMDVDSDSE
ncbi:unnamed protein product [Spirodela intermedia]|uniref:Smr domain-containing protein n=1 Tax=Spirodela intermedia TaxID=51605 RepID=A0A7I8LJA2_SPIIN|nr:unnamed protein product [Spirodela intermedia]